MIELVNKNVKKSYYISILYVQEARKEVEHIT